MRYEYLDSDFKDNIGYDDESYEPSEYLDSDYEDNIECDDDESYEPSEDLDFEDNIEYDDESYEPEEDEEYYCYRCDIMTNKSGICIRCDKRQNKCGGPPCYV